MENRERAILYFSREYQISIEEATYACTRLNWNYLHINLALEEPDLSRRGVSAKRSVDHYLYMLTGDPSVWRSGVQQAEAKDGDVHLPPSDSKET